jgi:hypothetical protein
MTLCGVLNISLCSSKAGQADEGVQRCTWDNGRSGGANVRVRLDRAVADPAWRDVFSDVKVHHLISSMRVNVWRKLKPWHIWRV